MSSDQPMELTRKELDQVLEQDAPVTPVKPEPKKLFNVAQVDDSIGIVEEDFKTYLTDEGVQNPPKALFLGKKRKRDEAEMPDFNGNVPQQKAFLCLDKLVWLPEQMECEKIIQLAPEGKFKSEFLDFPVFDPSFSLKAYAMTLMHRGYPYQKIIALLKQLYGNDFQIDLVDLNTGFSFKAFFDAAFSYIIGYNALLRDASITMEGIPLREMPKFLGYGKSFRSLRNDLSIIKEYMYGEHSYYKAYLCGLLAYGLSSMPFLSSSATTMLCNSAFLCLVPRAQLFYYSLNGDLSALPDEMDEIVAALFKELIALGFTIFPTPAVKKYYCVISFVIQAAFRFSAPLLVFLLMRKLPQLSEYLLFSSIKKTSVLPSIALEKKLNSLILSK